MLNEIKLQLNEYDIAVITKQNFEQIFTVYGTNQDFFMLVQGKKATITSSVGDIDAIPPNCTSQQKVYISIWKDSKVVGILDLIKSYPEQTCFWIGLLLVHGGLHGKGIGSKIVHAVLKAAKTAGYKTAQLGVVENNEKGLYFWKKHGFGVLRHSGNIIVMEKFID